MIRPEQLTGGVLAGGEARRLGGNDKGLLQCGGQPLAMLASAPFRGKVARIVLSANRNLLAYHQLGFEMVASDIRGGFQGPLAGVEALLASCESEWLWILPTDAISTPPDLLQRLLDKQHQSGADIVSVSVNGRKNPVCGLIARRLLADLSQNLDKGQRRVTDWYQQQQIEWVDYQHNEGQWIWSVNTPEELQQAEQSLNR